MAKRSQDCFLFLSNECQIANDIAVWPYPPAALYFSTVYFRVIWLTPHFLQERNMGGNGKSEIFEFNIMDAALLTDLFNDDVKSRIVNVGYFGK